MIGFKYIPFNILYSCGNLFENAVEKNIARLLSNTLFLLFFKGVHESPKVDLSIDISLRHYICNYVKYRPKALLR